MRRAIVMIVALAVVTAGCGEPPAGQAETSTTMPPTASSSTVVTTTAPAVTTTADGACPGCEEPPHIPPAEAFTTGPGWASFKLASGTYATRVFELPMSFTIDQPTTTFGDSTSWLLLTFHFGQHFIVFWGPSLLEDIDPVEWIQNQASTLDAVQVLAVEQTTLFGRPATQLDVSTTDLWYPEFIAEGQRFDGRTRFFVTEINDRPLLVQVSGISCSPFPMCTPDDADANQFQFDKYLPRAEQLLATVTFDG